MREMKISKLIIRIILWSFVVVLSLFIVFVYGGTEMLEKIEHECITNSMFQINQSIFECKVLLNGVLL